MTDDELCLDQDFSIGEEAFAALVPALRAHAVRTIVEFGAGPSSVRFAIELPEVEIHSIEHDEYFHDRTARLRTCHAPNSKLQIHLRPLAWQRYAGGFYLSYACGSFPAQIDAVLIDGPPIWTRRGREACLYQVLERLKVGACVYLDDFSRPEEQQIVRNWSKALGNAFSFRKLGIGHHWCVLQKQEPSRRPGLNLGVAVDSLEEGLRWMRDVFQDRMAKIGQDSRRGQSLGGRE